MSGIAAVYARGGAPVDTLLLQRMVAAQRFRGPDGESQWQHGSIGLGHTLHRTTVEAEREVSPTSLDDRLYITADARIDARDELCARLRDHGRALSPDLPDPELILHAYDAWGEDCLPRLLGDFTFALWDAPRRRLVCAVDVLGVKPFYYADRAGLFTGGNSLDCVRLHPAVRSELSDAAVGDFILTGIYQDRGVTIDADAARLPPGHFMVVDERGARVERYFTWPPPVEERWARPSDCVERFRELLAHAVRDRLRAPRVAVYMSGGIDSPLVALTAKRELARRFVAPELQAFCLVYDHLIADDERRYAEIAARSLSIPIDVQSWDDAALFDWVGRITPAEPCVDHALGPYLDQLARITRRFPAILTGCDGDTLLGAAVRLHWPERLVERRLGLLARELVWYIARERALPPVGLRTFLSGRARGAAALRRPDWLREGFWRRAGLDARWAAARRAPPVARSRDPSLLGFQSPAWGYVFDSYDPGSLRHAIDVRHPLMDLRLIRFALGLPAVPWCVNKHLLRACLDGLPEELRARPKAPRIADPIAEMFRRRGFEGVRAPWRSETLSSFVDLGSVAERLARRSLTDDELEPLLRVVALGAWLEGRDRAHLGRPSAEGRSTINPAAPASRSAQGGRPG